MTRRRPNPRKLLVASIGVATLNYLPSACSNSNSGVANLLAPAIDGGAGAGAVPSDVHDSGLFPVRDATIDVQPSPTVANLVASFPRGRNER